MHKVSMALMALLSAASASLGAQPSQARPAASALPDAKNCQSANAALGAPTAAVSAVRVSHRAVGSEREYLAGAGQVSRAGLRVMMRWPRREYWVPEHLLVQWYVPAALVHGRGESSSSVFLTVGDDDPVELGSPGTIRLQQSYVPPMLPLQLRIPYADARRIAAAPRALLKYEEHEAAISADDLAAIQALVRMAICRVTSGGN